MLITFKDCEVGQRGTGRASRLLKKDPLGLFSCCKWKDFLLFWGWLYMKSEWDGRTPVSNLANIRTLPFYIMKGCLPGVAKCCLINICSFLFPVSILPCFWNPSSLPSSEVTVARKHRSLVFEPRISEVPIIKKLFFLLSICRTSV